LQASSSSVFTSPWSTGLAGQEEVLEFLELALAEAALDGTIGASATGFAAACAAGFAATFTAGFAAGLLFLDFGLCFELTLTQHRLDPGDIPAVLLELRRIFHDVGHLAEAELEQPSTSSLSFFFRILVGLLL
jgi:hypothetical protein